MQAIEQRALEAQLIDEIEHAFDGGNVSARAAELADEHPKYAANIHRWVAELKVTYLFDACMGARDKLAALLEGNPEIVHKDLISQLEIAIERATQ